MVNYEFSFWEFHETFYILSILNWSFKNSMNFFSIEGGGGEGEETIWSNGGLCTMWAMAHRVLEIIQDCETCVVLAYLTLFKAN